MQNSTMINAGNKEVNIPTSMFDGIKVKGIDMRKLRLYEQPDLSYYYHYCLTSNIIDLSNFKSKNPVLFDEFMLNLAIYTDESIKIDTNLISTLLLNINQYPCRDYKDDLVKMLMVAQENTNWDAAQESLNDAHRNYWAYLDTDEIKAYQLKRGK